ncbi:MAG: hypothetical protein WD048_01870 [Chitinophagales bacterium]
MCYKAGLLFIFSLLLACALSITFLHDNKLLRIIAPEKFKYEPDIRTKSTKALFESLLLKDTELFSNLILDKKKLQQSLKSQIHQSNKNCNNYWSALENKINITNSDSALMLTVKQIFNLSAPLHKISPIDSIYSIAVFYPANHPKSIHINEIDSFSAQFLLRRHKSGSNKVKIDEINNVNNFLHYICSNNSTQTSM